MRKANIKGIANVKGFKFEVKVSIGSAEIVNDRHFCGNKDYDGSKKEIKDFNFEIAMEAEEAKLDIDMFAKDIKETIKEQIEKNTVSTTKAAK